MTLLKIFGCIVALVLIGVLIHRLHYCLIYLEERGYIYYRTKPRGGATGLFMEMDKLTRPSIEHVQQAMDTEVESEKHDGE